MPRWACIALLLLVIATAACGPKPAQTNTNSGASNANAPDTQNGARTKVEDLSLLINMPFEAQDVTWKQSKDQKKITAVVRFDPEDTNKLVVEAEKFGPAQKATVDAQSWFPDELTGQSDLHGDEPLSGKAYPANLFFQDPYNSGRVVRVDGTDFFVVELTAP